MRVYSLGYQGLAPAHFLRILEKVGIAVVIDVRENAWSHKMGFSKAPMKAMLHRQGIYYIHVSSAGNPRINRTGATTIEQCLQNYERFLKHDETRLELLFFYLEQCRLLKKIPCILCFEKDSQSCHRSVLLKRMEKLGYSIAYLMKTDQGFEIFSDTKNQQS